MNQKWQSLDYSFFEKERKKKKLWYVYDLCFFFIFYKFQWITRVLLSKQIYSFCEF